MSNIIFVKDLKLPFKYIPYNKNVQTYIKDYYITIPYQLKKEIKEVDYNTQCNILIEHLGVYYWCPFLDTVYRDLKSIYPRKRLLKSLTIKQHSVYTFVSFSTDRNKYTVTEVKKLLPINYTNEVELL